MNGGMVNGGLTVTLVTQMTIHWKAEVLAYAPGSAMTVGSSSDK